MQLNAELVNVAGNFGPLGFVLLQCPMQIGQLLWRRRTGGHRRHRNGGWLATLLAIQRHSGCSGVNDEWTRAMLTLEEQVPRFASSLRTNRVHHAVIKQRLYQRCGPQASCL